MVYFSSGIFTLSFPLGPLTEFCVRAKVLVKFSDSLDKKEQNHRDFTHLISFSSANVLLMATEFK